MAKQQVTPKKRTIPPNKRNPGGGGARKGSGRPRGAKNGGKTLSEMAVERSLEVSARYEKLLGKNTDELLHDVAHGQEWAEEANVNSRLKAVDMIHARQSPRIQEGGAADVGGGQPPAILPARKVDPAKQVH